MMTMMRMMMMMTMMMMMMIGKDDYNDDIEGRVNDTCNYSDDVIK